MIADEKYTCHLEAQRCENVGVSLCGHPLLVRRILVSDEGCLRRDTPTFSPRAEQSLAEANEFS